MVMSFSNVRVLLVLVAALMLGILLAFADGSTALATPASVSNPADRDAFGVTVFRPAATAEQESAFLQSARLRDDLRRAIVIR